MTYYNTDLSYQYIILLPKKDAQIKFFYFIENFYYLKYYIVLFLFKLGG